MTAKEQLKKIKEWVAKAQLKEAVDLLLSYAQAESPAHVNEVIALSSKYYEVAEMARNTTIGQPDYQRIRSQLIIQLLEKVSVFEGELAGTSMDVPLINIPQTYRLSVARTKVIAVLIATKEGLSIKAIQEKSTLKNRKYLIAVLDELIAGGLVARYKVAGVSLNELTEQGRKKVEQWV
ncbi:MAG: hypothetical protein AB8G86_03885 [Saprospiraceae bacterium]